MRYIIGIRGDIMKSKNICKFVTETNRDRLEVHRFIYETNEDAIRTPYKATEHRTVLIKQGSGKIAIDGKDWQFDTGTLVFIFSGENVLMQPEDKCEYMYIDFGGMRADSLFARFGISRFLRCYNSFDGLIPMWYDSLCRASDINLDLVAESILLYTFSRLVRETDEKKTLINRILEITEESFSEPVTSLTTVSAALSYNSKYISHIFKEEMGLGYSEYLRNTRIKYAVSLLEYGIDSIKNVAYLSGFSDPLYFSTVFKKTVGVSPKEYMNRSGKEQ